MSNATWSFLGVLVGAIVGALATYFANLKIEKIKARDESESQKANLKLLLKLEFEACLKGLDELKRGLEDNKMFMFRWINILVKSVQSLENLRTSFFLIDDREMQNNLFSLITDTSLFISDLQAIETWWGGLQKTEAVQPSGEPATPDQKKFQEEHLIEQRRLKLVELVDLKRRLGDVIRDLG